jgi:chromosome segregation ATPase
MLQAGGRREPEQPRRGEIFSLSKKSQERIKDISALNNGLSEILINYITSAMRIYEGEVAGRFYKEKPSAELVDIVDNWVEEFVYAQNEYRMRLKGIFNDLYYIFESFGVIKIVLEEVATELSTFPKSYSELVKEVSEKFSSNISASKYLNMKPEPDSVPSRLQSIDIPLMYKANYGYKLPLHKNPHYHPGNSGPEDPPTLKKRIILLESLVQAKETQLRKAEEDKSGLQTKVKSLVQTVLTLQQAAETTSISPSSERPTLKKNPRNLMAAGEEVSEFSEERRYTSREERRDGLTLASADGQSGKCNSCSENLSRVQAQAEERAQKQVEEMKVLLQKDTEYLLTSLRKEFLTQQRTREQELQQSLDELRSQHEKSTAYLRSSIESEWSSKYNQLSNQFKSLQAEHTTATSTASALVKELEQAKRLAAESQKSSATLISENVSLQGKVSSLSQELKSTQELSKTLKSTLDSNIKILEEAAAIEKSKLEELQRKQIQAENDKIMVLKQVQEIGLEKERLKEEKGKIEVELKGVKRDKEEADKKVEEVFKEVEKVKKDNEKVTLEKMELQRVVEKVENEKVSLITQNDSFKNKAAKLEQETREVKAELEKVEYEKASLESTNDSLKIASTKLEHDRKEIEKILEKVENEKANLKTHNDSLRIEVTKLGQEKHDMKTELEKVENEIVNLKTQNDSLQKEATNLAQENQQLNSEKQTLQTNHLHHSQSLLQANETLQSDLFKSQSENKSLQLDLSTKTQTQASLIKQLEEKVDSLQRKNEEIEEGRTVAVEEVEGLRKNIEEREKRLGEEIERFRVGAESQEVEVRQRFEEVLVSQSKLMKELEDARKDATEAKQALETQRSTVEQAKQADITKLEDQLRALEAQKSNYEQKKQEEIEKLVDQLKNYQSKQKESEEILSNLKQSNEELIKEKETIKQDLVAEKEKLQADLKWEKARAESLQQDLRIHHESTAMTSSDLSRLRRDEEIHKKEISLLKAALEDKQRVINKIEESVERKEVEVKLAEERVKECERLIKEKDEMNKSGESAKIDQLRKELENKEKDLIEKQNLIKEQSVKMAEKEEEMRKQHANQLEEMTKVLDDLKQSVYKKDSELAEAKKVFEEIREEKFEVQKKLENILQDSGSDQTKLIAENNELKALRESLEKEIRFKEGIISEKVKIAEELVLAHKAKLHEAEEAIKNEYNTKHKEVEEAILNEYKAKQQEAEQAIKKKEQDLSIKEEEIIRKANDLAQKEFSHHSLLKELQDQLCQKETLLSTTQTLQSSLETELTQAKTTLANQLSTSESLKSQLAALQASSTTATTSLQSKLTTLESAYNNLQSKYDEEVVEIGKKVKEEIEEKERECREVWAKVREAETKLMLKTEQAEQVDKHLEERIKKEVEQAKDRARKEVENQLRTLEETKKREIEKLVLESERRVRELERQVEESKARSALESGAKEAEIMARMMSLEEELRRVKSSAEEIIRSKESEVHSARKEVEDLIIQLEQERIRLLENESSHIKDRENLAIRVEELSREISEHKDQIVGRLAEVQSLKELGEGELHQFNKSVSDFNQQLEVERGQFNEQLKVLSSEKKKQLDLLERSMQDIVENQKTEKENLIKLLEEEKAEKEKVREELIEKQKSMEVVIQNCTERIEKLNAENFELKSNYDEVKKSLIEFTSLNNDDRDGGEDDEENFGIKASQDGRFREKRSKTGENIEYPETPHFLAKSFSQVQEPDTFKKSKHNSERRRSSVRPSDSIIPEEEANRLSSSAFFSGDISPFSRKGKQTGFAKFSSNIYDEDGQAGDNDGMRRHYRSSDLEEDFPEGSYKKESSSGGENDCSVGYGGVDQDLLEKMMTRTEVSCSTIIEPLVEDGLPATKITTSRNVEPLSPPKRMFKSKAPEVISTKEARERVRAVCDAIPVRLSRRGADRFYLARNGQCVYGGSFLNTGMMSSCGEEIRDIHVDTGEGMQFIT